jgi:hypothetical protein
MMFISIQPKWKRTAGRTNLEKIGKTCYDSPHYRDNARHHTNEDGREPREDNYQDTADNSRYSSYQN